MSLPAWGVWIEIFPVDETSAYFPGHSPHGECGLKYVSKGYVTENVQSLPAWGVWIEIRTSGIAYRPAYRHSPHGECGLKLFPSRNTFSTPSSLPAWGVWIEMITIGTETTQYPVTPRMGSVD